MRSAYLPAAHFFKVLSFQSETFHRKKKISEVNYRTFGLHHSHAWGKLPLAGCEIASCGYIANIFTNPFMKIHSSGYICNYRPADIFTVHIDLQLFPLDLLPCKYFHKLLKKIRSSGYICKYPSATLLVYRVSIFPCLAFLYILALLACVVFAFISTARCSSSRNSLRGIHSITHPSPSQHFAYSGATSSFDGIFCL